MNRWSPIPLAEVAEIFNGKTPSKSEQRNHGHPVLKIKDVSDLGEFRGSFHSFVDSDLADAHADKQLRIGDVLILNAAHNADYVGSKTYRVQPSVVGALPTGEWLIIRSREPRLDPGFAFHWMNCTGTRKNIQHMVKGIHLYPKDVARLRIPLPPLPEQRRIVRILDKAAALRALRRIALGQLDTLTQSIFRDMFGDLSAGEPRFPVRPLETVVARSLQNGAYFPKEAYCTEGGVEMVHMSDAFHDVVVRGGLKRVACDNADISKYSINNLDILVARRSLNYEGAAKPCLIPESNNPLIFESSFIRITPRVDIVTVTYLYHYLNDDRVRRKFVFPLVTQSTISGISQSNLARVPVAVPAIALQQEFGRRVSAVKRMETVQHGALETQDALFATLQQRAFQGKPF